MSDRTAWKPPTLLECYRGAVENARLAEQQLSMARTRLRALMPGVNELPDARAAVQQYRAEVAHWLNYAGYYRKRCEQEGDATVPKMLNRGDFSV